MDREVEEIIINVEFDGRQFAEVSASEIQVVPSNIQWEDLELMVNAIICLFSLVLSESVLQGINKPLKIKHIIGSGFKNC